MEKFDLIILGSGSAAFGAAIKAVEFGAKVGMIEKGNIVVTVLFGEEKREFKAEKLLMATGRKPNTKDLGLEKAGVKIDENGAVIVDEVLRTTSPDIWAAGDVIGEPCLRL